jgi:predicted O-linked N-acetylglucosamine transferase (SPINDLY family)
MSLSIPAAPSSAVPTVAASAAPAATPAAAVRAWPLAELMERASALQQQGRAAEAAALYGQWLEGSRAPLRHVALFNRGTLLSSLERLEEAEACYRDALAAVPGFAPALLNLGHLQERRGHKEEALVTWGEVFSNTRPAQALEHRLHALNNSARLLESLKRFAQAEALMVQSLQLKAQQPDVVQHYVHVRQKQCAWPVYQAVGELTPHQLLTGTSALAMMSVTDCPATQLLAATRFANERVLKPAPGHVPLHTQMAQAGLKRQGKVKIGYLSGDLHHHAVGLLIPELIELHDRSRFEVQAFCWTPDSATPQRQRLLAAFDQHTRLAGVDDTTAARLIAQAGIDVLVDLQALTSGARPAILAQRPAPVQVSYLGLPGTSALPGVDWILADRYVLPEAALSYVSEQPLWLPTVYQVSDRQRAVAPPSTRAAEGLPEDAVVFCSFNNTFKFTPELFACWMRVLQAVPKSVLWLLADNPTAQANLVAAAQAHGVSRQRLVFAGRVSPAEYLARFGLADVMLDTFPYNAGTTASDALWMGLPMVTLSGRSYISRMAGSLLTAVGLPDLITHSLADYEQLATTLGQQPARVASYKRYLAEHGRHSPLFDMPRIVGDIEAEFERLALASR